MACKISLETYNGLPALYANAGKWVDAEFHIKNDFYAGSGTSNKIIALGNTLTFENSQWANFGFVVGDVLTLTWTSSFGGLLNVGLKTATRTITYINGNILYMDTPLAAPFTNLSFPSAGQTSGMAVKAIKQPQSIEFTFNLTKNGTTSQNSVIDGELNRFIHSQTTSLLSVNDSANMVQLGNKSGGIIKNVVITRLADTTASVFTYSNYKITFKFLQWGLFEDANLYGGASYLAPIIKAITLPLAGNPNGTQQDTNGAKQANTGYFNENYNGGANPYIPQSIAWLDALGNSISKMDYSGECTFTAVLTTPGQVNGNSIYRIGLGFTPETDSLFKNLLTSEENNLIVNAPDVNFLHSATPSATVYTGALNSAGAGFDLTDLQFSHSGGTLTVTGKVTPTGASTAFFDTLADGERNMIMWVQASDYLLTGTLNNEVNVLIYDNDCFDAPSVGVQYPYVVDETLFDIAGLDIISTLVANTTTEDNLLYIANLRLPNNTTFDGIRCTISARNTITDEVMELESNYFNFSSVPYIGGGYQLNQIINRPFNISPLSNRNEISLELNAVNNSVGFYGVQLNYAFMNDWRYWISDSSVDEDFFLLSESNNGLNKNWQRFQNGDWILNIDFYVRKNGVEDFNHLPYINRIYEDDPSITAAETFTGSNNTVATNLLANDIQTLDVVFNWNLLFDAEWVEITIEDFESGNRWLRNSLEDIGTVTGCPLKPIDGETRVALVNGGNTLTASVLIDTNLVNAQNVSLTYRVYSNPKDQFGFLVTVIKDAIFAIGLRKLSSDFVYSGPLIEVYHQVDDVYTTINTLNGGVDIDALLDFAGSHNLYISKYYDQSGANSIVSQTDYAQMDLIVELGVLVTDPTNGFPAAKRQANGRYDLSLPINTSADLFITHVFTKTASNQRIIGLGNEANEKYTFFWERIASGNLVFTGLGDVPLNHGEETGLGNVLVTTVHGADVTDLYGNGNFSTGGADDFQANSFNKFNRANGISGGGLFQEIVIWDADKTALKTLIELNIMGYYGL